MEVDEIQRFFMNHGLCHTGGGGGGGGGGGWNSKIFYESWSLSHWGRIHKISSILSNVIGDGGGGGGGGGGYSFTAFYSVKLYVMINLNLRHNVLCFSFVVVLYYMYGLYAIIRVTLFDERGCHV